MLFNSDLYKFLFTVFLCLDIIVSFVLSVGENFKNKVSVLDEDVVEPQYRDSEQLLSLRHYALEDFFWTGSGDGPPAPDPQGGYTPSSVATTTLLATVYIETPPGNTRPPSSSDEEEEECVTECPIGPVEGDITPSRPGPHGRPPSAPPDQRYWLLTVLQAPAIPLPQNLDVRLAKLYRTAFLRQQEEHLGIISSLTTKPYNNIKYNKSININIESSKFNKSNDFFDNSYNKELELKFYNDAPANNYSDFTTEAPFEYITNFIEMTSAVPRKLVRRSLLKNDENSTLEDEVANLNISMEVVKRQVLENQPNVEVFLYNVTRESEAELKVIYWVSVGGRPVPALTAAKDMKLLADAEVVAELGYPVTTKAEPYLKSPEPLNGINRATNVQDTWLIFGATILAILLLIIMIAFLLCRLAYNKKSLGSTKSLNTRPSIDSKGVQYPSEGKENVGYSRDDGKLVSVISPSKSKGKSVKEHHSSTQRYVHRAHHKVNRVGSADSSTSTSSSSDLSQMNATLRQRQKLFEQQIHNEYAIINKKNKSKHRKIRTKKVGVAYTPHAGSPVEIKGDGTLQRFLVSDPPSPSSSSPSNCGDLPIRRPTGAVSPTSYLSMPSVKSFPRSNVVEPLSRVLEPLSVRHLDMDSPVHQYGGIKPTAGDGSRNNMEEDGRRKVGSPQHKGNVPHKYSPQFLRLGSMDRDPGVVGPVVWDLHNQRIKEDLKTRYTADPNNVTNISRMRQRFTELVDDAFSLFGSSGQNTPKSGNDATQPDGNRAIPDSQEIQSVDTRELAAVHGGLEQRPFTALPARPPLPRQFTAWDSIPGTSSMSRSTSAGGAQRRIAVDPLRVNSEGYLSNTDPALPLLQAIRSELSKLPGTSDA